LDDLRDLCLRRMEELLKGWERCINKAEGKIDAKLKLVGEEDSVGGREAGAAIIEGDRVVKEIVKEDAKRRGKGILCRLKEDLEGYYKE
jgi:hypothetical protein